MSTTPPTNNPPDDKKLCPSCGATNNPQATRCVRCGAALPGAGAPEGGRTIPMGGRTQVIGAVGRAPSGLTGTPRLEAPPRLDLGVLRRGDVARGKLRVANSGSALLTGAARVASDTPWLRLLGSGAIYCAAGAVESLDVQVATQELPPGRHQGTVVLETDGGQAGVQVVVAVLRESRLPFLAAALITAAALLGIAGLVYATNGGKVPFAAPAATSTPTLTATAVPTDSPTAAPSATATREPSVTPTPPATATTVDTGATATAAATQAQGLVVSAGATATALAADAAATSTAVTSALANQAPGAIQDRQAVQTAVNHFLVVRTNALRTVDASQLPTVAMGQELLDLQQQITDLRKRDSYTKIVSIEAPVWDSIKLATRGPGTADATLTKHEDEVIIRNATGLADDQDPSYHGKPGTLRNQRFAVTYHMKLVSGAWLVDSATVIEYPNPLPTPETDLLPPPSGAPVTSGGGTATPVPTVQPYGMMTIEDVVKGALPGVLRVTGDIANNQQSTGTGFVIKSGASFAYVVTNDHVVNGASDVTLSTQDGTQLPAIAVQEDSADDLAVIKIAQPATPFPALTWGDSDSAQLGEQVVAIGFALGLQGEPSVSNGIISALNRDVGQRWTYLQHTAPINHGNSGGPLLDMNGTVIGINTLLDENAQSVYFAIPSSKARGEVATLIAVMS